MTGTGVLLIIALVFALVLSVCWRIGRQPPPRDGDDTGQ